MRSLVLLLLPMVAVCLTLSVAEVYAAQKKENAIASIDVANQAADTAVKIVTKDPVGYRYTVYDSFDPVRVVVDFPGMDVSEIGKTIPVKDGAIQEVRVSSFDLTSGKLGRVEMLLTTAAKYEVSLEGNTFQIRFDKPASAVATAPAPAVTAMPEAPAASSGTLAAAASRAATAPVEKPADPEPGKATVATVEPTSAATAVAAPSAATDEPKVDSKAAPVAVKAAPAAAQWLQSIKVENGQILLRNDGTVGKYQYFKLGSPPRLVVDLFDVKPQFKERTLPVTEGFKQVRVGTYPDKTRLVFDAAGSVLPQYSVMPEASDLIVSWNAVKDAPQVAAIVESPAPAANQQEVTVEAVDFDVRDGQSYLTVSLSAPGKVIPASASGNTVGFGVKHANISRALRRTLDASAFPSAVKRVTPYTVLVDDSQDVRFAVELKGAARYSLKENGTSLVLAVDNDGFAQQPPVAGEVVAIPVPAAEPAAVAAPMPESAPVKASPAAAQSTPAVADQAVRTAPAIVELAGTGSEATYSGQKITLVFDDADILNILQLIAEVSNLNIVASDDVKGTITLRLVDVPWDQALDLIMEIKDLGMVKQGNIARIMPREKLRAMEEARMNASRTREKLEDLKTELITVNYADLGSVSKHVKGVLTKDREGVSVSEDTRNKQLIVTSIPSNLADIRNLISKLDTPERQVMIEARIVEASSTFSRDLGVKWGFSSEGENRDMQLGNNQFNLGLGGSFLISPPAAGSVIGGAGMGAGFTFGSLTGTSLDLRISALEAAGQGKVISTPRISTLNGGQAKISQGTKIPYQSSGPDGPKTEFVDANLELTVTPVINPDNSMILDISATNSSIGNTVSTGTGGNAPAIDTREAKTKLLVRDGETTVIGGIFVETDNNSNAGVPLLMHLPLVGHLFKSSNRSNTRAELLIFITPRIVN
ncbi:type IV pilus secretin family protein [Desulfuromonas sp. DDH964]|uniref:type IV pilus secretin family protein n=1 Tax=Desulfuromonas sp. DDH964 TaxID=1823759 RepID=UPI0018D2AF1A|nr:type IV pilus secretin family protein [Desulfuromonas sp. DDH964]